MCADMAREERAAKLGMDQSDDGGDDADDDDDDDDDADALMTAITRR